MPPLQDFMFVETDPVAFPLIPNPFQVLSPHFHDEALPPQVQMDSRDVPASQSGVAQLFHSIWESSAAWGHCEASWEVCKNLLRFGLADKF